jgi:translocation and assembly module TamB
LVSNTPELRAVAAPDLNFGLARDTMELRGQVVVPSADIDLERLDRGVSASADVVVLDPADPARSRTSPLDMDLAVTLGKDVKIKGFGMDGRLAGRSGALAARLRNHRHRHARRGRPVQGLRAETADHPRPAGLEQQRGLRPAHRHPRRAQGGRHHRRHRRHRPRAGAAGGRVVQPEMQRSEALSYLVLGRSLDVATTDEASQVTAASAALSAGSGLLASQLGANSGWTTPASASRARWAAR